MRANYETKCRQADEAEDDARFSGIDVASLVSDETSSVAPIEASQAEEPGRQDDASSSAASTELADPVKLERRQTLRKQFGFTARKASADQDKLSSSPSASEDQATKRSPTSPSIGRSAGTFSTALSSALSTSALQGIRDRLASAAGTGGIAERWKRLRRDADRVETEYLQRARQLDQLRCNLEDVVSTQLSDLQKFETERLAAVKTLLSAYSSAMGELHPSVLERSSALVKSHGEPAELIKRLVSSAKTGHYRPLVEVFHPFYHDVAGSHANSTSLSYGTGWAGFGMNLNARWRNELLTESEASGHDGSQSEQGVLGSSAEKLPTAAPLVLSHLLASLERAYEVAELWGGPFVPEQDRGLDVEHINAEKRKAWIYDVPLASLHRCRDAIIQHVCFSAYPGSDLGAGLPAVLDQFDPPTRAGTVKLWLAELEECLMGEENWTLVTSLYKAAESVEAKWKADQDAGKSADPDKPTDKGQGTPSPVTLDPEVVRTIHRGVIDDLSVVLGKLSSVHLVVLDSIMSHLRKLVDSTQGTTESDQVFANKVALSLGPSILRPSQTTPSTLASKGPVLLLMDLLLYYDELLPPALARKNKREEEVAVLKRKTPRRQRTKVLDQRIRRSHLQEPKAGESHAGDAANPRLREVAEAPSSDLRRTLMLDPSAVPAGADYDQDENSAPTPKADRILSKDLPGVSSEMAPVSSPTLSKPVLDVQESTRNENASAYATPKEEISSPLSVEPSALEGSATAAATSSANARPSSPVKEQTHDLNVDEDTPLSNVARLSRQFNSSGSLSSNRLSRVSSSSVGGTGAVRGPRPVGSASSGAKTRNAAPSDTSTT